MNPSPDLVVFLTDGASSSDSMAVAKNIGRAAKRPGVKVNTIALMEPKARAAMSDLAKITGGTFSLIDECGKKVNQPMAK